jgi:hypothetical protein
MLRRVFLITLILWIAVTISAEAEWLWVQSFTGTGSNYIMSTHRTDQNQIYAAGYFSGTVNFGNFELTSGGGYDGFIALLNADGYCVWANSWGGEGNQTFYDLTTDAQGNVYVGGVFNQNFSLGAFPLSTNGNYDIFFAKLSSGGQWLNAVSIGSAVDDGLGGLALTPDGSLYLAGSYRTSISIDGFTLTSATQNVFISKWDSQFNSVWAQQFVTNSNYASCTEIGTDQQGNCYLLGSFDYYLAVGLPDQGSLTSAHADAYVLKLSPSGAFLWADRVGSGSCALVDGFVDTSGNCYVSCDLVMFPAEKSTRDNLNVTPRIAKVNSDGIWQWYNQPTEVSNCLFTSVAADQAGNCFLAGNLVGDTTFGEDVLTASFSDWNIFAALGTSEGDWQWGVQTFDSGPLFYTGLMDIEPLEPGFCLLTGYHTTDSLTFGEVTLPGSPTASSFLVKAGPAPSGTADTQEIPVNKTLFVYPNPSQGAVTLQFSLEKSQSATLAIYNIKGQLVKYFPAAKYAKGLSSLSWDGLSVNEKPLTPGVYLLKLTSETGHTSRLFVRQ